MAFTSGKNGKAHVLEISNRATVSKLSLETISEITSRIDSHESGLNTNAHGIDNIAGLQTALNDKANTTHTHSISDVPGLQTALDDKADSSDLDLKADMFTGFTGSFSVVTHVDFPGEAVTTKTITVSNGVIVSVV